MSEESILPNGWSTAISSQIIDVRDGTHDTPKYVDKEGIPLITSKNLKDGKIDFEKVSFISKDDHIEISKRSGVEKGDILFAMIGTIGNPVVIKGNEIFSIKNVGLFRKNEAAIVPEYLCSFLSSRVFEHQLEERKLLKGTTQKFIPLGNLRDIQIPLPPLPEQHRIVAIIEELFSSLDKGIESLKTAQEQLKVYRQAVLKWAFEGLQKNSSIKNEFDFIGGGTPSKAQPKYWNGNLNWCSVKDVKGDYLTTTLDRITEKGLNESAANLARPNEVILITRISPGKTIITKINTAINQDLKIVKPKRDYEPKFTHYLFQSIERDIIRLSSGTTVLGINLTNLKSILIPSISIEEQQRIVSEIESRLSVCDKIEESITTSLQQAEALRQSILKKAFEGKLVEQDPNDEPASVLLERIKAEREAFRLAQNKNKVVKKVRKQKLVNG